MFKPSKIKHFCNSNGVTQQEKLTNRQASELLKKQTVSSSVHPDEYTIGLRIGRKVVYHQNFGGAPIIQHKGFEDECEFVKNLSTIDLKKMNGKADYLRLFE